MQEVLLKLQDGLSLLNGKIKGCDARQERLEEQKTQAVEVERKQKAANSALAARERIVKKYENLDDSVKMVALQQKSVQAQKMQNKEDRIKLDKGLAQLAKDRKTLDDMRALYSKKRIQLKADQDQFDKEKKDIAGSIITDYIKSKLK